METFSVANFDKYQHYRDRNPPWIKFHYAVFDDYAYAALPDHAKAHLNGIWLLASRHENKLPFDAAWIARRINATCAVDLEQLASAGFIVLATKRSKPLARRKQDAVPEAEAQDQAEAEKIPPVPTEPAPKGAREKPAEKPTLEADFEAWWTQYPRRKAKDAARAAYGKARTKAGISAADLLAGAMRYAAERANQDPQYTALPTTWLNQGRWADEPEKPHVASLGRKAAVLDPDEQVRRRRAQLVGGLAALHQRGRHDPGGEGGAASGGEAGTRPDGAEDHPRADDGRTGPDGRMGGDVQPPAEGLGQGVGFLPGGPEASAGGLAGDRDGAGKVEPPAGDAPTAAAGDRGPGAGRNVPAHDAQDQAVPGAAVSGGGPRIDAVPGHDASAEGGVRPDAGGLEQQIQLANRELEPPAFLRRTA